MLNRKEYQTIGETIYTETLPNGLEVVLLPKRELTKTYAIFATNYGSIDQSFIPLNHEEKIVVPEGIAHFLEHKLFEKEDRDVFQDFGKYGASANAFTSFTTTAYLFSATNHIKENVEILLDFVQDPFFSEESVEKEKGIIAQEINMYDDQPDWRAFMGTIKNMYKDHPVRIDIAGTVESIQQITKDDLYTCYETFYHPSNMVMFIAGNFEEEQMIELIRSNQARKKFSPVKEIKRFYPNEQKHVNESSTSLQMNVSLPKVTIGIKEEVDHLTPKERLKKDLLLDIVLDYFYSKGGKHYRSLYEASLIDGSFFYDATIDKQYGFTILGSNTREAEKFVQTVHDQLLQMNRYTMAETDFQTLKNKKIGQLLQAMNSLEYIASQYIHYRSLGIDFFTVIQEVEQLTMQDLRNFLATWISPDRLTSHHIVPEK